MRKCKECGKEHLTEGYVIFDGDEYYCSSECLLKNYNVRQYGQMYKRDEAYWTTWEDEDQDND